MQKKSFIAYTIVCVRYFALFSDFVFSLKFFGACAERNFFGFKITSAERKTHLASSVTSRERKILRKKSIPANVLRKIFARHPLWFIFVCSFVNFCSKVEPLTKRPNYSALCWPIVENSQVMAWIVINVLITVTKISFKKK